MISNKNFNNNVNIEGTNFSDCNFYGNSSASAGLKFKDCNFYGNSSASAGLKFKDCNFYGNSSAPAGLKFKDCNFYGNSSASAGLKFKDCNFYDNSSAPKNAIFKDCKFYGIMKSTMEINKKRSSNSSITLENVSNIHIGSNIHFNYNNKYSGNFILNLEENSEINYCSFYDNVNIKGNHLTFKKCKFYNKSKPIGENLNFINCRFLGEFRNSTPSPSVPPFDLLNSANDDLPPSYEEAIKIKTTEKIFYDALEDQPSTSGYKPSSPKM